MIPNRRCAWMHIGAPKTGTTSIQEFVGGNRERLRDLGISTPEVWGNNHFQLAAFTKDLENWQPMCARLAARSGLGPGVPTQREWNRVQAKVQDDFLSFVEASKGPIVLSSEHMYGLRGHELEKLRELMDRAGLDATVLLWIREPLRADISVRNTQRIAGIEGPGLLPEPRPRWDYRVVLERWEDAFPDRIRVRLFEAREGRPFDVVEDL